MTIRSILRHRFCILMDIIAFMGVIIVIAIIFTPVLIINGIPAGISAWWNEKPIIPAISSEIFSLHCYEDPNSLENITGEKP